MKEKVISAAILAASVVILGLCLKGGIDNYVNKDRQVTVKGLAEKEVEANKVTWNLSTSFSGDDLPSLYKQNELAESKVMDFLKKNGVKDDEIFINSPTAYDREANGYYEKKQDRYSLSMKMSVSSKDVKKIQNVTNKVGELMSQGIAIASGDSWNPTIKYDYEGFNEIKPELMKVAIANAEKTAQQFAENSHSKLNKIITADQGQIEMSAVDDNIPYRMKIRVVATVTYSLKD